MENENKTANEHDPECRVCGGTGLVGRDSLPRFWRLNDSHEEGKHFVCHRGFCIMSFFAEDGGNNQIVISHDSYAETTVYVRESNWQKCMAIGRAVVDAILDNGGIARRAQVQPSPPSRPNQFRSKTFGERSSGYKRGEPIDRDNDEFPF